jgi:hypothetical protein
VGYQCIYNANRLHEDIMQEDVHICRTNFAKKMEQNSHEKTSRWKMYGKRLFFEDLEVRDVPLRLFHNSIESFYFILQENLLCYDLFY